MPVHCIRSILRPGLLLILLLSIGARAEAQRVDLDWSINIGPRGFYEAGVQVVFGPTRQIELPVTLVNDEDASEWVQLDPGIFDAVQVKVVAIETGHELETDVRWREDAQCSLSGIRERCVLALRNSLPPTGSIRPIAVLVPSEGGEFPNGDYLVEVDFTAAKPLLRGADSQQWQGRIRERGSARLRIREMSGRDDLRRHYGIEGGAAMVIEGDLPRALGWFERWMNEFPDEPGGYAGAGRALLEQGRFQDAAPMFERALARGQGTPPGRLLIDLAAAYVAMGEEARGIEALQRHALPARVAEIMDAARSRATRIQAR